MATTVRSPARHRQAVEHAVDATSTTFRLALGATEIKVNLPPVDKLAFYAGLGGAAALGVLEWPVATVTALGHLLSEDRHNRMVRALGEALDAA